MAMVMVSAVLVVLPSCGRSSPARRDAGAGDAKADTGAYLPDVAGTDGTLQSDGPFPSPDLPDASYIEAKPDLADASLADLPARDAPPADLVAPPADLAVHQPDLAPFSCASLRPLVDKGVLTTRHAKAVLFAPDGKSLLLRVSAGDAADSDEALLVSLPGGEQRTLATDIREAEWLGTSAALFTTGDELNLRAVSLGGDSLRTVAVKTCSHAATPDGSRLYYTHDCTSQTGAASVLEIASGATKQLATRMSVETLVVSPGSRWAAYVGYTNPLDASTASQAVHVVDQGGTPYAVAMPDTAYNPVFASDQILLFQSPSAAFLSTKIWRHYLGTSDTPQLLAEGDGGSGYEWNADRSAFLLAKLSSSARVAELYSVSVSDGRLVRLASDLMDYSMFAMRIRAFAFAPSNQRAIYFADVSPDGGRSYGLASVAQDGGGRLLLGSNVDEAVVSPYADRIAFVASNGAGGVNAVTVVSSTTGVEQFKIDSMAGFDAISFVPGDRGLLFVDTLATEKQRLLRHLSFTTGGVTTLAEFRTSRLLPYTAPTGIAAEVYPIDPAGCFVPVDSDLDQPGTRLVLLPE